MAIIYLHCANVCCSSKQEGQEGTGMLMLKPLKQENNLDRRGQLII